MDPTPVVNNALTHGWEAGIVAILVLGAMSLLAWMFRFQITRSEEREKNLWIQAQERENRLAKRIDQLEQFINQTLVARLESNTLAMERLQQSIDQLNDTLTHRPCLLPDDVIEEIHQRIKKGIA